MLRRAADKRCLVDVEEHLNLHRQYHLGHLPDRHLGGLRDTAGAKGASRQGDDGRGHHPGGQLHRPFDPARGAEHRRRL